MDQNPNLLSGMYLLKALMKTDILLTMSRREAADLFSRQHALCM